jgi:CHASE2 domain-containing sensor protein
MPQSPKQRDPLDIVRIIVIYMVAVAWFASVVAFLAAGLAVDPWVHFIFAAVATFLYGAGIWRRNGR